MNGESTATNERFELGPGPGPAGALIDIVLYFAAAGAIFGVEELLRATGWFPYPGLFDGAMSLLFSFFVAAWLMKWRGQSWRAMGLKRPARWWTIPVWGLAVMVVIVVSQITLVPILAAIFDLPPPDLSRYDPIIGNFPLFIVASIGVMITGGFIEEFIYRGLMVDRLARLFGGTRAAIILAALLCGAPFGLIHFKWGIGGMMSTTILGATLGLMYLATRRNLWPLIAAHALLDLLLMVQVYTGMLPQSM